MGADFIATDMISHLILFEGSEVDMVLTKQFHIPSGLPNTRVHSRERTPFTYPISLWTSVFVSSQNITVIHHRFYVAQLSTAKQNWSLRVFFRVSVGFFFFKNSGVHPTNFFPCSNFWRTPEVRNRVGFFTVKGWPWKLTGVTLPLDFCFINLDFFS